MNAAAVEPVTVTEPGVYAMPDDVYLADPVPGGSLSHSGVKTLLAPGCPALFAYQRKHGRPDKSTFDFGRAAHRLVLGEGTDVVGVDAPDWRTKEARAQRDEIRAKGLTPLLAHELAVVEDMAEALAENALAVGLLGRPGQSEAALFAVDERDDVWLRAKIDRLPDPDDGRLLVADYKTTPVADAKAFERAAYNYGYFSQAAWYIDLIRALGIAESVAFLFIAQAKEPPYLSIVCEPDPAAIRWGRARNREAIGLYAHCTRTGHWPGPSDDDVLQIGLPGWVRED